MQAPVNLAELRGVYCCFCDKSIRLSPSFIKRETAIKRNEQTSIPALGSRVYQRT